MFLNFDLMARMRRYEGLSLPIVLIFRRLALCVFKVKIHRWP
ncbi:hypothetical protein CRENPOLYSF1_1420007 [Crenothrix polyspora]|uniref:Uncharacterized protein n=1 Tax=Crenothrix polyspora TaxID=360316 RepID=A0A1R4H2V9_9GAMM|nr:hypothetical protein CRENPOLYSF1_1420007 [Crenothrix polyspora]